MLSRVAESIYWMSRQAERAENHARFIEVTLHMMLDQTEYLVDPWEPLVQVTGDNAWFEKKYGKATCQNVVQFLAFDREYHSSMLTCLHAARENARSVREALSTEAFEELNAFYHFVRDSSTSQLTDPTAMFFDSVRSHALMWTGVLDSTMSHDMAWHFLNVGRLLERADKTSRILDVKYFNLLPRLDDVGTAIDDLQWSTLLLAISGFEAYRREHHLMDVHKIVAFFLFHRTFPRSVDACIAGVESSLREIEKLSGSDTQGEAIQKITSLRLRLKNSNVKEVLAGGMHQFIDRLQVELNDIGDSLVQDYFYAIQTA
ncbi:alpha-E domain-containing protein [Stieleria sp. TO1_6]|uniref:alpha-E domain-containing protein n=1 Tax=Stieleria tagensis TaxID=2956795 RepID=UPI0021BC6046|nr:alpha-E domain-containing protein [Stieleria tagensis]MCO8120294.1 alpha-E domain-containing protein [Stieleria tagensis]